MRNQKGFERPPAWTDRFRSPSSDDLRESVRTQSRHHFEVLRRQLLELDGVRESIAWYGDCWHWSFEYRTRLSDQPLAVLIPAPFDLQLALPIDEEFTRALPLNRLKRAVRDGLDLAKEPYNSRWGVWSVTGISLIEELQDLIEMKLKHLTKAAG